MRQSWTDDRLDDFRGEVNRRFGEMDQRLYGLDRRLDGLSQRFDKLNFTLLAASLGAIGTMVVGCGGIIITQL